MRIFNLAEELEKERKKNKELKKQLKLENEYTKYLPEGVEYILLTKETYDTQQNELQDQVFYLQERIDKARIELDYLIHRYYTEESYELTIEEIERIMNILKGE